MNAEVRSSKPINSLYFHFTQRNAIICTAIDCKNYEYLHTIPIREPNGNIYIIIYFKVIRYNESS